MKVCFKCRESKPLDQFYKHKQMGDGHLNKCITCAKSDVKNHRQNNIEKIREYDRLRGNRQTPEYLRNYRLNNPEKYKATSIVNNAMRDKKLFKEPCEICGDTKNIHAHHDDYSKPLNVRWLCAAHHSQWHHSKSKG